MFLLIPYKVCNTTRRLPYVTAVLIAANVLVFILTSDGIEVYENVVNSYALRWSVSPWYTYLTSHFIHNDLSHLLLNMLFLGVFGAVAEDRLGMIRYAGVYLLSGFVGDWLNASLVVRDMQNVRCFGASAGVSGILGLFWYLYPWSQARLLYCAAWFWQGTIQVAAVWVIGAFFVIDVLGGITDWILGPSGVGHMAHVGGTVTGAALALVMRLKKESRTVSLVKSKLAKYGGDAGLLDSDDLRVLVEESNSGDDFLCHYAKAAMLNDMWDDLRNAIQKNPTSLMNECPEVADYCADTAKDHSCAFPAEMLLRLAILCEQQRRARLASELYDLSAAGYADEATAETALYRSAQILWTRTNDGKAALLRLNKLLSRFHCGALRLEAEDLRDEIVRSNRLAA